MPGGSTDAEDAPAHCLGRQVTAAPLAQKGWVAEEDCSSPGLGANRPRTTWLFRSLSRIRWSHEFRLQLRDPRISPVRKRITPTERPNPLSGRTPSRLIIPVSRTRAALIKFMGGMLETRPNRMRSEGDSAHGRASGRDGAWDAMRADPSVTAR